MKIGDFIPQIKTDNKISKVRGAKGAESSSATSLIGDRVEISAGSLDVQKMKGIIQNTPDLRMDKVQALKEQIERGDYEVDPYRVADKMLMNLLSESEFIK
ncbi:MAG TPA: flagellar biosynthesis anti-sigma factor FlgM [Desulfobacterales bacterium]|nr:flagellar biosynthesis anti-sigma factor FlgM [Desulfobacterales bacterium]